MRIALVHDYLREYGGAERVVETLHTTFPNAPLYTAFFDKSALGEQAQRFSGWEIRQSRLTRLPFYKHLFSPYRIFSAWAFGGFDFSAYDVVISSTNMYMAKAIKTGKKTRHLSYIHTPARSLYGLSTRTNWKKNPFIKVGGELINIWMRYLDFTTAQNPDVLIANSQTTKERIAKYYRRDAVVIPPPVAMVDRLAKTTFVKESDRKYLLFVGRLVVSKHPEIAVEVAKKLKMPLKIVGTGPMLEELKERAVGTQTEFLGSVDDEQLAQLYSNAKLLFFPAEDEDFGMVPIEALAAGTPVIAHFSGEPRFTIQDGVNGLHVTSFDLSDWVEATKKLLSASWEPSKVRATASTYSEAAFCKAIRELVKAQ